MAAPAVTYATLTLSNENPLTGESQLRRTPLGLRRMYPDSESCSTEASNVALAAAPATTSSAVAVFTYPVTRALCLLCLLLLLLLGCAGAIFGIVYGTQGAAPPVPINTTSTASPVTLSSTSTGTTSTVSVLCSANQIMQDIYFLIDTSAGLAADDFQTLQAFLSTDFVNEFVISNQIPDASRFTLIGYNDFAKVQVTFDSTRSTDEAIKQIQYLRQTSSTVVNLGEALTVASQVNDGNRPSVQDTMLIFISENSQDEAQSIATQLKQAGTTLVTIALGTLPIDLTGIASSAQDEHAVTDFARIQDLHDPLLNSLCRAQLQT